jgi:hypothetical protein
MAANAACLFTGALKVAVPLQLAGLAWTATYCAPSTYKDAQRSDHPRQQLVLMLTLIGVVAVGTCWAARPITAPVTFKGVSRACTVTRECASGLQEACDNHVAAVCAHPHAHAGGFGLASCGACLSSTSMRRQYNAARASTVVAENARTNYEKTMRYGEGVLTRHFAHSPLCTLVIGWSLCPACLSLASCDSSMSYLTNRTNLGPFLSMSS